jgi:hypothetical protein
MQCASEDAILHSHRRENLKSYVMKTPSWDVHSGDGYNSKRVVRIANAPVTSTSLLHCYHYTNLLSDATLQPIPLALTY